MKSVFVGKLADKSLDRIKEAGINVVHSSRSFLEFHDWILKSPDRISIESVLVLPNTLDSSSALSNVSELVHACTMFSKKAVITVLCTDKQIYEMLKPEGLFPNHVNVVFEGSLTLSAITKCVLSPVVETLSDNTVGNSVEEKEVLIPVKQGRKLERVSGTSIVIVGLEKGVGVSTITAAIADMRAKDNIQVAVVELPSEDSNLREYVGVPEYSVYEKLNNGHKADESSVVSDGNLFWFPAKQGDKIDPSKLSQLFEQTGVASVVLFDVGSDIESATTREAMRLCDLLYVVMDSANYSEDWVERNLKAYKSKLRVVLNKTDSGALLEIRKLYDTSIVSRIDSRIMTKSKSKKIFPYRLPEGKLEVVNAMKMLYESKV